LSTVALLLAVAGCAALSDRVEVPEESLQEAAVAIERTVVEGEASVALKDQLEFKARSPEISLAVMGRQSRIGIVAEFKRKGYVGESVRALLTYVKNADCRKDARLHSRVANVILSENADRWRIYEELARLNRLSGSGRKLIQTAFHEARIELARPGDMIQLSTGASWTKKAGEESAGK
jgi:uncharacterized protein YdbL (DUF1318 family)